MTAVTPDIHHRLESLVGHPFRADNGETMTVLKLREDVAVVRVGADRDEEILVAWLQWAVVRLLSAGEVVVPGDAFGSSTEIVVMLLLRLSGAQRRRDGTVVLGGGPAWNIRVGEAVERSVLHARFGGNPRTRLAPSASTTNVFVFVRADQTETGFWRRGVLYVPGERVREQGQSNANRALAGHREAGRVLRVFLQAGDELIYAGAFETALREPFYFTKAEGRGGVREQRIVFRLVPAGAVVRRIQVSTADGPAAARAAALPATSADEKRRLSPLHLRSRPLPPFARWLGVGLRLLASRGPWPAIVLASCVAIVLTTWGWSSAPVRPAVTSWFLLVCPGMALVRLLPDRGLLVRLVLAVAASLVLETLLATFMLEANAWAPGATLAILLLVSVAATVLDLAGGPRLAAGAARLGHAPPEWTRG